ncbi:PAS domain S-box protein [uncultured Cyclobacterium sp.]|uniref:PAS domain S-box protein n=1 Tax=uncultured Cyclobacterium sp. TaxID=453820 RepID=UPI0030EF95E9|tara:strand:- start:37128 stop:40157 length:3030 start_codon:yes stop_codon:yes gene_type:complete
MNNLYIQKVLVIVGVLEDYMLVEEKFEEIGVDKTQLNWIKTIGEVTSNHYDLVICDLNLPKTDRNEILGEIKLKFGQTPIIALTSNVELSFYITLIQEGFQDVLFKETLDKVQLYRALRLSRNGQELGLKPLKAENRVEKKTLQQDAVTYRKKDLELKDIFQRMSLAVSQPKDLAGRFEALLKVILGYTELKLAEGWIMNIDDSRLNKVISCTQSFDFDDISEIKIVSKEAEIGRDLPGTVWEKGKLIFWENLENHPGFKQNKAMLKYGLKTAVGIPIFKDTSMVGVITLFSEKEIIYLKSNLVFFKKLSQRLGPELMRIKTEDELKTIFDLTPNLLFVIDSNGIIKKGNLQTAITLDCLSGDLPGKSFRELVPEDFQPEFDNLLNNIDKNRSILEIDIPILVKDHIIWINLTTRLFPSGFFIYCVGKDTTHQKSLEELLYRAHKVVRMGTWEINLINNSVYWSPMVKVIHELNEQYEPKIHEAINFYKEGDSRNLIEQKVDQAKKGEISHFEVDAQLVTSKGNIIWVRVQAESEWLNGKLFRIYGSIQDISERKNVEEKLEDANIRYRLASQAAAIGIYDWDILENNVIWNDTMKKLYGITENNLTIDYQTWQNFLLPNEVEKHTKVIQEALDGKVEYNTQYKIILPKTGEIRIMKATAHIVRNDAGTPIRMVGINYDITNQEMYRLKLEKANKDREDILESITDGFFSVDRDWIVTYWNNAAEKILLKSRKNIVGKNLWVEYGDAIDLKLFKEYAITMETGEQRQFVDYYPGMDIWLEISSFPKENGIVVYFKDISSRIKHQQKMAEVKLLQEHVINSTEDLIWAVDDDYKLILANNAFYDEMERLSGHRYSIGERVANFTGKNSFLYDEANSFWNKKYKKVLAGFQQNLTYKSILKHMEPKTFQVGFYPILDNNKITGAACFARDITDKINHLKALERQNKKLKDITWRQSHIVRAPVARIMGLVNLQKNMNYSGKDLNEILDYIMDSSEELDEIIRDISKRSNNP